MTSSSKPLRRERRSCKRRKTVSTATGRCDVRLELRWNIASHIDDVAPRDEATGGPDHGLRPEHPSAPEIDAVSALN